ncbi:MAG: hypothetical protein ACE5KE_06350 [Methanosarcinales archaeon]
MESEYFEELVKEWKNLFEEGKEERAEGIEEKGIKLDYYGIILTVGFTPKPLIHDIVALEPKNVYFLCTPESNQISEIRSSVICQIPSLAMRV